jgi:hypothetical protein
MALKMGRTHVSGVTHVASLRCTRCPQNDVPRAHDSGHSAKGKHSAHRGPTLRPRLHILWAAVDSLQTDRSVDPVAQMQQRQGAVPVDPAARAPGGT